MHMRCGKILELFIVVLPASAAILYAVLDVPEMDALMEGRRHHVFYWACKRSCADVKLVAGCIASLPCFGYGDVSVGSGRALNRDDGFFQLAVEILRVQSAENFLKVSCSSACFDGFFHFRILTFVFSISASVSRRDKGLRVVPR